MVWFWEIVGDMDQDDKVQHLQGACAVGCLGSMVSAVQVFTVLHGKLKGAAGRLPKPQRLGRHAKIHHPEGAERGYNYHRA